MILADPSSMIPDGLAPWVAVITNGGVLVWLLMKHLPDRAKADVARETIFAQMLEAKDKAFLETIARHEAREDAKHKQHSETVAQLRTTFEQTMTNVMLHCKEELSAITEKHFASQEQMEAAINRVLATRPKGKL